MDTALQAGQFNNQPPVAPAPKSSTGMASTNPNNNILTQGQSYQGGTVGFDTATGKPLAKGATTLANPVATQSTTTLSSNKTNDITGIQNTTNGYAQGGVTTNPQTGVATSANGNVYTPYTPPEPEKPAKSGITPVDVWVGETPYPAGSTLPQDANGNYLQGTSQPPSAISNLQSLNDQKAQSDALTAQMVSNIEQQYTNLLKQQQKVNAGAEAATQGALFRSGAAQGDAYAQNAQQYQITQGVEALAQLESQKQSAILAAKQAGQTQNFKLQEQINNQIASIAKAQSDAGQKLSDTILAAQTKVKEAQAQNTKDNAISSLYQSGTTDVASILSELKKQGITDVTAKDVSSTVDALTAQTQNQKDTSYCIRGS